MIIFKKLRWKNFLSTGNIFTELELNSNGNTLIVGENGAGKSTLLDALSFGLFGKPFRKINKPQLLNSITQKQLLVEIEFSINKNEYKIVRGMKPNVFEVYKDNKLLNQSAEMKDYQEVLENQIIKVNHKSFCQVVVLGSATFQPFMQLTAQQRREIIEDLLDLQIFTSMNSLLKDKVLLNTESINKSASDIKLIEEKITLIKEHLVEMQSNNEKIIEEKKQRVKDTVEQVKKLTDEHKAALIVCEKLQEQLKDEEAVSKKINKLGQLKHQIEANLGIINKEVNFFHKYDNCPTCKQQIDEQFKSETVETKQKEIENIQNGLEKLAIEYENTNNKLNDLIIVHADINSKKLELNSIKTKINSLLEYRETLDEEINRIAKQSPIKEDNKIPDLEKQLKEIQTEYSKYLEEKNILSVASALLKDGGIKSKIVKQYVPIINKLINKYLSAMEFMCQFELDEQFNETIKSRYRDIFSYSSFSEGEKMRINLAILFAWRAIAKLRNSINTNLLIMDEVFDSSLDSNGTDEFLKIIKNLTSDTNTFIISHKTDQLYDKFEKVIKFEKHKSFSKIAA
jgi:DNA repair exonuclease SbcCD ATPase subunit